MARKASGSGDKKLPRLLRVIGDYLPDADADLIRRVEARVARLLKEVAKFARDIKEVDPERDDRRAFELWALQKIAGLQVLSEWQAEQIRANALAGIVAVDIRPAERPVIRPAPPLID